MLRSILLSALMIVEVLTASSVRAQTPDEGLAYGATASGSIAPDLFADAVAGRDPVRAREEDREAPPRNGRSRTLQPREMVDELITTARRRNETVQNTPVAVTSFGSDQIVARDVRRLSDADGLVPNLAIDNSFGAAAAGRLTIRGVGQIETTTSFDPAVGLYIDGAYVSRSQGQIGALFDIERIEVLRGPQGTLYGKNTIGGAINVTTRKPEFDFGASGSVRVGNFGRLDTRWTVNLPLVSEKAALRVALASNYDDGYEKNRLLGERLATDRLLGGRSELLWLPANNVEVMLSGEYSRENRKPQAAQCLVRADPSAPVALVEGPEFLADGIATCAAARARKNRSFVSDIPAEDDFRVVSLANTVNWEIGDSTMVRSITSFRNQHYDVQQDLDGTELGIAQSEPDRGTIRSNAYTQELQLSGRLSGSLFYVLGVFASGEKTDDDTPGGASLLAPELQRRGANGQALGALGILPYLEEVRDVENRSLAAYGSVTYSITSRLSATAGLRRTVERRRLKKRDFVSQPGTSPVTFQPVALGETVFEIDNAARFSDFSPSASLSYQLTPRVLTYLSYATGFRSGGFNGRANFLNPDVNEIKPEDLTTYEAGMKSSFLDSRLVLNAAGFYSVYEDIQRPIVGPGPNGLLAIFFRNAAEARLHGVELEMTAIPFTGLKLESSIGAFRGRYTDFDDPSSPSIDDARLPGQPNYLMSFAAGYQLPVSWLGLLAPRVQWTHRGEQANDARDTGEIRSSKYGILDARLSLALNDGSTEVTLFGSNLLDREYINNGIDASDTLGRAIVFQGSPRRYGVEIAREF